MAEIAAQPAGVERRVWNLKNTILAREQGFFTVFLFSVCSLGLIFSGMIPFTTVAGLWPGADLVGVISVAMVVALLHAYIFTVIGSIAPNFGADYVIASRVVSPPLAFAFSWTLVIFLSLLAGVVIASIPVNVFPHLIQTITEIIGITAVTEYLAWVVTPSGIVTFGTISVLCIFLILIFPPQITHRVIRIAFVVALFGWCVLYYQLASGDAQRFAHSWDIFMGSGSFLGHLLQARALGMQADSSVGPMIAAGLMLSFWIFWGYSNPVYMAGEVKQPEKNLRWGSLSAILLSWAMLVGLTFLLYRLAPVEWFSAQSFLHMSAQFEGQALPFVGFYGAISHPNIFLTGVVGLAWFFSIFVMAHVFLYTASRIILGWARDRLVPEEVAVVHPVFRSPMIAVLLVCVIAELSIIDAGINLGLSAMNTILVIAGVQFLPVLGITLLPFLKKDWFAAAPAFAQVKIGPVPVISLAGGISLVYMVCIMVYASVHPIFNGVFFQTLSGFAAVFLLGLAWYYTRRYWVSRGGENLEAVFKHLPEK